MRPRAGRCGKRQGHAGARDVPTHPRPHHQPPAHQEHEPERMSLPFLLSPLHTRTHRLHYVLCSAPLVQSLSSSHRPSRRSSPPSPRPYGTPFAAVASASPLHLLPARLTVGAPVAQARLARAQPTRTRTPYSHSCVTVTQPAQGHADAPTEENRAGLIRGCVALHLDGNGLSPATSASRSDARSSAHTPCLVLPTSQRPPLSRLRTLPPRVRVRLSPANQRGFPSLRCPLSPTEPYAPTRTLLSSPMLESSMLPSV